MAANAVNDKSRDFWSEAKKMRQTRTVVPMIDGETDNSHVANLFKDKYQKLYTSVPSNQERLDEIDDYVKHNISREQVTECIITQCDVSKAINELKCGKSDGTKGLISDHIKHAPKRLHLILALILTTATRHGHMPNELLLASVTSIPKDVRSDLCNSDNYRGIALSSCLSKIYDIIILRKYSNLLCTSEMQYAFKSDHGTTLCTLALKEVTKYYLRNRSDVFIGMLDASKAFDRLCHEKLFNILIERNIPPVVIRILFDSYRRQKLRTVWNGCYSEQFGILNGVKQGGIASPVLFTIYMDVLLQRLELCGAGCTIGNNYFGALSYADDLAILSPTIKGLQVMLNVCETFGKEFGVTYNPSKSVALHITKQRRCLPNVLIAGQVIKWVNVTKHLGNYISDDMREIEEIAHKRGDLIGRTNYVLATFREADPVVKQELFNSQCSHLYGTEAWQLNDSEVHRFTTTWNQGVRRVFSLPRCTHTKYLQAFVNRQHVMDQIYKRFYKLHVNMMKSENKRIASLAVIMIIDSGSITSQNMQLLCNRYGLSYMERFYGFGVHGFKIELSEEDQRTIAQIKEIQDALQKRTVINDFHHDELFDILNFLCTS